VKLERIKIAIILLFSYSLVANSQTIEFVDAEDLPEARSALTSAHNEDRIFVVNGFGIEQQYTSEVFQYDTSIESWSVLTSSTIPKRFASAEVVGDYLYVFNGQVEGGSLNSAVEKINLEDGSIQYLADNPKPCRAAGVSKWNGKIYSFGGYLAPNSYSSKLYEFDPSNDTWIELTQIPIAGETKGEVIDGKLYVIGGYNGTVSNRIDIYDIASGTWEGPFEMPLGNSAHATAVVGSKIYMVGDFANLILISEFDTFDNTFQYLIGSLNQRRHCAAEGINGTLYAIGGNTTSSIQSSISSVQKADIITSTYNAFAAKLLDVHPNPAGDFLNIGTTLETLTIFDAQGRIVTSHNNISDIDVSHLQGGLYMLTGMVDKQIYLGKFIKK